LASFDSLANQEANRVPVSGCDSSREIGGYQLKTGQNAELAEAYLYHDPMTKKQNNPEYTRSQQSYRH